MIFIATCSSKTVTKKSTGELVEALVDFGEVALADFVFESENVVGYFFGDRDRLVKALDRKHSGLAQINCHSIELYSISLRLIIN